MLAPLAPTALRRRLFFAVALPFFCMAILTALLLWQVNRLLDVSRSVDHSYQVISQAQFAEKTLLEMQNASRGFVITRQPEMLDPFNENSEKIDSTLAKLRDLVNDNFEQSSRVAALTAKTREWRDYANDALADVRAGKDLTKRIQQGQGRRMMDDIAFRLDEIINTEQALRTYRTEVVQRTTRIVIATGVATTLVLSVLLALFSLRQLLTVSRTYAQAMADVTTHADSARASEERFRLMVDGITDYAMFLLDPSGKVISWNRGAQRITDYPASDIVGQPFSIFFPPEPDPISEAAGALKGAEAGGRFEENGWRMRQDRSKFWAWTLITALRDEAGKLRGFSHLMRDLTDTKRVADALVESEDRYRRLVEWSPDGIFVHCEGIMIYANPAFLKMIGAKSEDVIGKPGIDFIHPDYHPVVRERMRILMEEQRPVPSLEEKLVRLDGSTIAVELSAVPFSHHGKPGAQVMVRDITQRKLADDEIRRLNSELFRRIGELEEQLEKSL